MKHIIYMYRADHNTGHIKKVPVLQVGIEKIWIDSVAGKRPVLKNSNKSSYHDTKKEANEHLVKLFEAKITDLKTKINKLK